MIFIFFKTYYFYIFHSKIYYKIRLKFKNKIYKILKITKIIKIRKSIKKLIKKVIENRNSLILKNYLSKFQLIQAIPQ